MIICLFSIGFIIAYLPQLILKRRQSFAELIIDQAGYKSIKEKSGINSNQVKAIPKIRISYSNLKSLVPISKNEVRETAI